MIQRTLKRNQRGSPKREAHPVPLIQSTSSKESSSDSKSESDSKSDSEPGKSRSSTSSKVNCFFKKILKYKKMHLTLYVCFFLGKWRWVVVLWISKKNRISENIC